MTDNTDSGSGAKAEGLRGAERPFDDTTRFLREMPNNGRCVVSAIVPGGGSIETRTFELGSPEPLRKWLEKWNGKRNLYFVPNLVSANVDPNKKPGEADIEDKVVGFVDIDPDEEIDPSDEEAWQAERQLILERLEALEPSAIVDSGNGYQGYWVLDEPFFVGGTPEGIREAKGFNVALVEKLDGDDCESVDHLMRLPGTMNVPSPDKRDAGRTERLASVVRWPSEGKIYELGDLSWSDPGEKAGRAELPREEPIRLNDTVELKEWGVPADVVALIVEGDNPDRPYKSKSHAVWRVACQLVNCRVPPALIVGILIDVGLGISAHVRKQKRHVEYAWEQVEKATAEVAREGDRWPMRDLGKAIEWVNERYFAALEGTDYTFFREDADRAQPLSLSGFRFELADKQVIFEDGKKKNETRAPISQLWVGDARRRVYPRGLILDPSGSGDPGAYNLWRGFGVEPAAGDWSLMKAHIRDVLARGNAEHAAYIESWTAWGFQNPATPPRVALVFRGGEGVGKGLFASNLVKAFGHHGLHVMSMGQVSGRFNAHLRHCCLLYADEVDAQDGNGSGALRGLISERTIPCEGKHKDLVQVDNHVHLVMASNDEWVVPAGKDARRYAVFDVSGQHKGNKAYFTALADQMENGGLAAMIHDMLKMDLTGFHPESDRPETVALGEQRAASLKGFERIMFDLLAVGELPKLKSNDERGGGRVFVSTLELTEYCKLRAKRDDISGNAVAGLLEKLGAEKRENERPRGWVLLPLANTRALWGEKMFPVAWKPCVDWGFPVWQSRNDYEGDSGPY